MMWAYNYIGYRWENIYSGFRKTLKVIVSIVIIIMNGSGTD